MKNPVGSGLTSSITQLSVHTPLLTSRVSLWFREASTTGVRLVIIHFFRDGSFVCFEDSFIESLHSCNRSNISKLSNRHAIRGVFGGAGSRICFRSLTTQLERRTEAASSTRLPL